MSTSAGPPAAIERLWCSSFADFKATRTELEDLVERSAAEASPWAHLLRAYIQMAQGKDVSHQLKSLRAVFAAVHDEAGVGWTHAVDCISLRLWGKSSDAVTLAHKELLPRLGSTHGTLRVLLQIELGRFALYGNDIHAFLRHASEAVRESREMEQPLLQCVSITYLALGHIEYGNWDESLLCIEESLALAVKHGFRDCQAAIPWAKVLALIAAGRITQAEAVISKLLTHFPPWEMNHWFSGLVTGQVSRLACYSMIAYVGASGDGLRHLVSQMLTRSEHEIDLYSQAGQLDAQRPALITYSWSRARALREAGGYNRLPEALKLIEDALTFTPRRFAALQLWNERYLAQCCLGDWREAAKSMEKCADAQRDLLNSTSVFKLAAEIERSARRQAEETARMKGIFLANMSHEIRTPMNAILGLAYLVLDTELTSQQRGYLLKMQTAATHLLRTLNNVLDYSKAEAGFLQLESIPFEIEEVLFEASSVVAGAAFEKGIEVIFDLDPAVPTSLIGDPLRLGHVLINLLSNAAKFTHTGEVMLSIKLEHTEGEGVQLHFEVADTGIGMSAEQIDRIFSPFSQADPSVLRRYGGTGLGLSIAKKLVQLMGGEIEVSSTPGRGSCFEFRAHFGVGPNMDKNGATLAGQHVVLLDPHPTTRRVLERDLRSAGALVCVVNSAPKAVEEIAGYEGPRRSVLLIDSSLEHQIPDFFFEEHRLHRLPPFLGVLAGRGSKRENGPRRFADRLYAKPILPRTLASSLWHLIHGARDGPAFAGTKRLLSRRYLVVEDNVTNQEITRELLEKEGAQIDVVSDGASAVDRIRALPPDHYDAVLMDLHMPVLDGIEATRRIRADPRFKALAVIALTADTLSQEEEGGSLTGVTGYLTKPVEPETLVRVLLAASTERGVAQAGEANAEHSVLQAVSATSTIVNLASGLSYAGGDTKFYSRILMEFISRGDARFQSLAQALADGDIKALAGQAHALHGAAASLGMTALALAAKDLERYLRNSCVQNAQVDILARRVATELTSAVHFTRGALVAGLNTAD